MCIRDRFYTSAPIEAIPVAYWRILFPQMYWTDIKADAERNGLDPYMVASLIRQETEFNPAAISNKSAYGLMQLLPSVGRSLAKEEGIRHFQTTELLNPSTNIRLGTLYPVSYTHLIAPPRPLHEQDVRMNFGRSL